MASFFNSTEADWGQYEVHFNGVGILKLRGNKYKKEHEDEELYAAGTEPIDIKSGNTKYSGELKVLKGALDGINQAAQAAGYADITEVPAALTTLVNTYKAKGTRTLQVDVQLGVKIGSFEKGFEQGAKFMEITLPYKFLGLKQQFS